MPDPHCRISRITDRKTGKEIRVLSTPERPPVAESLVETAIYAADDTDLVGWALVVWDGNWDADAYCDTGESMPNHCVPDYVKSVLQQAHCNYNTLAMLGMVDGED